MSTGKRRTSEGLLPGDPSAATLVDRIIRVDHAGEYGAVRIYEGQLAVLGRSATGPAIRDMADKEREHLDTFNRMIGERRVRPTALLPVWHVAGYALGAVTAAMGPRAAMACTVAVEEVIDAHYARQDEQLGTDETELRDTVRQFREDELEHRDTALAHEAQQAPGYEALSTVIKTGSRIAIWLSERI